jgi:DNA topoisomerase-1
VPTFTAFAVTSLLEHHFPKLVDLKFTARMEQSLDDIAEGHAEWLPYLAAFYLGKDGLQKQVQSREKKIDPAEARTVEVGGLDNTTIRIGRFGPYIEVERGGETLRASVPRDSAPADLTNAGVEELLRQKLEGPDILGHHPTTGEPILVLTGQYGPYVQLGQVNDANPKPKRASLPKGMKPEDVTLETAVGLLALPRILGVHADGSKLFAGQGRFGPYIVHDKGKDGKDYRSLKGEDHVLTVTLRRALELLAQPKLGRGRHAARAPLKELGPHPEDQAPVALYDGQYGPYVKHGTVSASIPKGSDPQRVTLKDAVELLAAKRGRAPARRPARARAAKRS